MRKEVDKNSQGLQNMEFAVHSLQRRISLATDSLVRRIEALECGKESHVSHNRADSVQWTSQKRWHEDAIRRLDDLVASTKDSQDFSHSSLEALAQELHKQDGDAVHPLDALKACSERDPSHVMCLETLKEKWDEIPPVIGSDDGAGPLEGIGTDCSCVAILQVGQSDSESSSPLGSMFGSVTLLENPGAILASTAGVFGHKASRLRVPTKNRDTQQRILDSAPQRADACDGGDTRMATAAKDLLLCGGMNQEVATRVEPVTQHTSLAPRRSGWQIPCGRVNQQVVTSAKPVTLHSPMPNRHLGLPTPCGQVNQQVVTSARPVTSRRSLTPCRLGSPLPRHSKTRAEGP